MPEFLQLIPIQSALERLMAHMPESTHLATESIPTIEALGRVLAEPIQAPHPLPEFPRSTVDGFAVQAADTFGASSSLPAYLKLSGEIRMGQPARLSLEASRAAVIHTGAMLPQGADAVVMLEDTQSLSRDEVEILRPVAVGENVIEVGEDVAKGEIVMPAGRRIRTQEIGGLLALGYTQVPVYQRPRVGIISSGDEIVPPHATPELGQVRDINSYTLGSMIVRHGGEAILRGVVKDDLDELQALVERAHHSDDLVIVTAGSSVSARDLTATAFSALGKPGILVHGISIKPGKPTILAVADGIPVVGLPGNPVSAFVVGSILIPAILERLYGLPRSRPSATLNAILRTNVASQAGREDFQPVRLWEDETGVHADPIYGRSNLIFTLVRADGLLVIPSESTGFEAGTIVQILPF
ncbi:MAG: molybdopterin molybdotransferase MoeA [Anaerolineales bacterium]|nr:MAG: molybdopterin molybdotransferase MoeA [Anaerolineales bacterium]